MRSIGSGYTQVIGVLLHAASALMWCSDPRVNGKSLIGLGSEIVCSSLNWDTAWSCPIYTAHIPPRAHQARRLKLPRLGRLRVLWEAVVSRTSWLWRLREAQELLRVLGPNRLEAQAMVCLWMVYRNQISKELFAASIRRLLWSLISSMGQAASCLNYHRSVSTTYPAS